MRWFELSLISVLLLSLAFIGIKFALTRGFKPAPLLFIFSISATIITGAYLLYSKDSLNIGPVPIVATFLIAVAVMLANLLIITAVEKSPNPGYVSAVLSIQAGLITIASIFLFKSPFSVVHGVGIALATIGIIIVGLK